ncbi:serine/threonine protein kinase [Pseudenhygromyxa sp. WMMC2535]|uniref:serine/threonine-protein kinase n=1 Tax=Pseudenhygromyxa sp. WMMC2535 TaxID=2712867 RepID=UPI00159514AD|nr:serine/threonine-protein kinase [Pseudenhygromyxa sp. WMMC2535]NVB37453.1 serine/threonine protein kinase [Pseudenhygromyxa sp. WMMC2535]
MHTRSMELHSLGGYRLLGPIPVLNSVTRLYYARPESAPEDAPATQLAKILMPSQSAEHALLKAQFAHEANLLRSFSHTGIPSLRAAGTQDGVDFYVMDYVEGVDLSVLLGHDRGEPRALSKELAVYILGQLADALRYVHTFEVPCEGVGSVADALGQEPGEGADDDDADADADAGDDEGDGDDDDFECLEVLHRDICPANVFLSVDGDVVLGDFGSASSKWLAADYTSAEAGHVAYKAPERVTGSGKATVKSDLFSLAVVLWELLRGERCFVAGNELETMDEIVRFDISHSSRRVSGLSPKLSEVLRRNLDRDPERRYPDAYKVLQRLSQSPEAQAAEASRHELARLVQAARAARK